MDDEKRLEFDQDVHDQILHVKVRNNGNLTMELIKEAIHKARRANDIPETEIDIEQLIREITYHENISIPSHVALVDDSECDDWLINVTTPIEWLHWDRYKHYLAHVKRRPDSVIFRIGQCTEYILNRLGNPKSKDPFDRRGLAVGNVQVGKTENFNALISKTVDVGYKLILVLSGMQDDLRMQTHKRIDEDVLGKDTEYMCKTGVGFIEHIPAGEITCLTKSSLKGDFYESSMVSVEIGKSPIILVMKKNSQLLSKLIHYLNPDFKTNPNKKVRGVPLLVIDDEADNGSLNNRSPKKQKEISSINRHIRTILHMFEQSSYVGFTATPYANMFSDSKVHDALVGPDLFPKHFILSLQTPSNYIGAKEFFGLVDEFDEEEYEKLPLTCPIEETEKTSVRELVTPVKSFVVACAIRNARGQTLEHKSMLVHVERLKSTHKDYYDDVESIRSEIVQTLEGKHDLKKREELIADFKAIWESEYEANFPIFKSRVDDPLMTPVTWEQVEVQLYPAAKKIKTRLINGDSHDKLDYKKHPQGLSIIVVGGDKLSRGITLEGLSTSYYLRMPRAYDTLFQNGRWFGYRPGYVDTVRLYTTKELLRRYRLVANVEYQNQNNIHAMNAQGAKPREFGFKILLDPEGAMFITNQNKLRSGRDIPVTFSEKLVDVTYFHKDKNIMRHNFLTTREWLMAQKGHRIDPSPFAFRFPRAMEYFWEDVPPEEVIRYLSMMTIHPQCTRFQVKAVTDYIRMAQKNDNLTKWSVVLRTSTKPTTTIRDPNDPQKTKQHSTDFFHFINGEPKIGSFYRATFDGVVEEYYHVEKDHLASKEDECLDLDWLQVNENAVPWNLALKSTLEHFAQKERSSKEPDYPKGPHVRAYRPANHGLLLIYPLDSKPHMGIEESLPFMGIAVSFPKSPTTTKINYRCDEVMLSMMQDTDEEGYA